MTSIPAGGTLVYGSSLRAVSVEQTLQRANSWAKRCGITRVTDTTRLDYVGIPVYASIRPDGKSLCVNAGKGLTAAEAKVGAFMEAIEFALAEWGASDLEVVFATPDAILDGKTRPDAILDFCPLIGATISGAASLPCIAAEEISSGQTFLIPAELVFLPMPAEVAPKQYFGSSSTGLCSGNTLMEATVHGLAECIERDIASFHKMCDRSRLIPNETLPPQAAELAQSIDAAGLELYVRYQSNPYDLPCIYAVLYDPDAEHSMFLNGGYGCHPHAGIAAVRAICEAVQSRLTVIHGGRDDLIASYNKLKPKSESDRMIGLESALAHARDRTNMVPFTQLPDHAETCRTIQDAFDFMAEALARVGIRRICRVVYTLPTDDLHVARIVVPGLECFNDHAPRVGRRLRDYVQGIQRDINY